ncbi:hypothetical protein PF006_g23062, partial [Phytophthora fragariae]
MWKKIRRRLKTKSPKFMHGGRHVKRRVAWIPSHSYHGTAQDPH